MKNIHNIFEKYHIRHYNFGLILLVISIAMIGVFMVGSAAPALMDVQLSGVIGGIILMVVISLIDYKWVLKFYWPMYIVNLVLLLSVALFGTEVNGATRWLRIGDWLQFQPTDLTKIIVILFFAKFFMMRKEQINKLSILLQGLGLLFPSLVLVYRQPDFSNMVTILIVFCVVVYLAGLSYKIIGSILAVAIPAAAVFLTIAIQPNQTFIQGFQQDRILAWLNPEEFADATAFQQINSVIAIGAGQLFGKGYNNDSPSSLKNGNFILESQTDFIFAVIGEELGFVGCSIVILLLLLIVIICISIGMRADDLAGRIICGGIGSLIGIQSFINIAVATQMIPNTGLSLPFVSYGLTSVISFFIGIGFVLNVGLQPKNIQRRGDVPL